MEVLKHLETYVDRSRAAVLAGVIAAMALSACTVAPKAITQGEVVRRVQEDSATMYLNQAPIVGPISMEEAVARALKYNLDYRLKKMETALALGLSDYANYDMLPKLLTTAGYRTRNNDSGGTSIGILDRQESLRPSTSEERGHKQASAEFSWNLLDFGVSYYRAKQQADQFLIAEERRRKVVQGLLQDVRAAYWRALGAQRLESQAISILQRANVALERSREAEAQRIIAPALALNYQRALLDATTLLNQRRQDLAFARNELSALMNVPPGVEFTVADAKETALPAAPSDLRTLEEMALMQRPELREEDFKKRITADETRKQILGLLPGLSLNFGANYDSNRYAYNTNWLQGGVGMFFNLMRLAALPSLKKTQEDQVKVDDARRAALSMAIMTQLRVAVDRYRLALEDFNLADRASQVDMRLANYTRASVTAKLDSELEAIRTQARAVLGAYQRANSYANAQIAFGRLYNTLGFDAISDNFDSDELPILTARIRAHLLESEKGTFALKSNLFAQRPKVSVRLTGVDDPLAQVRMRAELNVLLARNEIVVDAEAGIPLTFALNRNSKGPLESAGWVIKLTDGDGQVRGISEYVTTLPDQSRSSVYESALLAAASQALPKLRNWLTSMEMENK